MTRGKGEDIKYAKLAARLRTALKTIRELKAEENASFSLTCRQSDLLTGVVNALKGAPPPDTLWSHHEAPELARKAAARIAELEAAQK